MNIALIAHDKKKDDMVVFVKRFESILKNHTLITTGTTGLRIMENTKLTCKRMKSGPLGGDLEIGAMIANDEIDMIIFMRDPLTAQPHEPDITALLRLCDVYNVALATNANSGERLIESILVDL
ncbi:methylglyoxal synthase [Haloplasma contractile]|uniref:Methylglyoxal synthase n=1 Tax=Haloplasma contractile SSD-17B TaxID=1033810 RepID=U2FJY5_9MOLU|nr:methylglyoxal synthase [Haloplasma contractile]ERJ11539.1 Methylglyoxal synthase protein [Haloplasma contractile SSD-17B]